MKIKNIIPLFAVCALLSGCVVTEPEPSCEEVEELVILATTPQNVQSRIFLVNQNTGELACCTDTEFGSAEDCALALEKECFKRVEDIPYNMSKDDILKANTYPTRRWRDNEHSPRW